MLAVFILLAAFGGQKPAFSPVPPELYAKMLQGAEPTHYPFGFEFQPFRPLLPPEGAVSFIMDFPFSPYIKTIDQLYTAQSYLAPRVLNPHPGELAAIIYCSSTPKAEERAAEAGYRILVPVADGKAVAARTGAAP